MEVKQGNHPGERTLPASKAKRTKPVQDSCPQCNEADLEGYGGKHKCPVCGYIQPCCNP